MEIEKILHYLQLALGIGLACSSNKRNYSTGGTNMSTTYLTAFQEKEAVKLFNQGHDTYVEIARLLNVPYQAVNSFMTKWKKQVGILKKRSTRSDKKIIALKHVEVTKDETNADKIIQKELTFLREFYKSMQPLIEELQKNS